MTLEEAFNCHIITKLDVCAWINNNKYSDFSIIYEFKNKDINFNNEKLDIIYELKCSILYYNHMEFYSKVCKRIFALDKYKNNTVTCIKLNEILSDSQFGILYNVYCDMGTILWIISNEKHLDKDRLLFEIDQFKNKLSNVYKVKEYLEDEPKIFQIIDHLESRKDLIDDDLIEVSDMIFGILNRYTAGEMEKIGLFPVPKSYFP
jgi:hypothetical protein